MWMQICLPGEASLWRGEHEPEVQSAISAAVRPGAVFYDVGAHVGTMTLGTARLVGESGRVIAFDGDPENIQRLLVNSERNGLQARIRVVHGVVWSRTATDGISFRRGTTARSHGGVEADGNRPVLGSGELITVPAITLDDFIAAGAPSPQLIKVDVEGGEYEVLRGGDRLFAVQRPFIIVEVHHQQAADLITAWLGEYQYCGNWEIPVESFPRRLFAWPTEQDGPAWIRARLGQNQAQEDSGNGRDLHPFIISSRIMRLAIFFKEPIALRILVALSLVWIWKRYSYRQFLSWAGVLLAALPLFVGFAI
jgi:FkbM family methyltransferase